MSEDIQFSANLGFLWKDLPLPDAIREAGKAGFNAVECHMPYAFSTMDVNKALSETGLLMESLNTRIGVNGFDDLGVAAMPGREQEARQYIDEAIAYAVAIGCSKVSVVAGRTGRTVESEKVYRENLAYATKQAKPHGKTILIEPLNTNLAEDYHLVFVEDGIKTIESVGADNLKLMIDCFHTVTMEGNDLLDIFQRVIDYTGHIQISAFPDRGEPVGGEIDYHELLPAIVDLGYRGKFGAEYSPRGDIHQGLSWLETW